LKVQREESLGDYKEPVSENSNFQKAVRFSNSDYKIKLQEYDQKIRERLQEEQYNRLLLAKNKASTEEEFQKLAGQFKTMNNYKKSSELSIECGKQYQRLKESREEKERKEREHRAVENARLAKEKAEQEAQKIKDEKTREVVRIIAIIIYIGAIISLLLTLQYDEASTFSVVLFCIFAALFCRVYFSPPGKGIISMIILLIFNFILLSVIGKSTDNSYEQLFYYIYVFGSIVSTIMAFASKKSASKQ
jgi:cation transport ATPase